MPRVESRALLPVSIATLLAMLSACQSTPERSAGSPEQPQVNIPCCEGFKIDPPRPAPLVATVETPLPARPRDPILDDPIANANTNRVVRPPGGWEWKAPERSPEREPSQVSSLFIKDEDKPQWMKDAEAKLRPHPRQPHYRLDLIRLDWTEPQNARPSRMFPRMVVRCNRADAGEPCLQTDLLFSEILRNIKLWSPADANPDAPGTQLWKLDAERGITCGNVLRGTTPMRFDQDIEISSIMGMKLLRNDGDGNYTSVSANERPRTLGYRFSNVYLLRGGKWGTFSGLEEPPEDRKVPCVEVIASGKGVVELIYADALVPEGKAPLPPADPVP